MGGHFPLEQEDGGGPAGDGLPTWEGCPSHHDPPDVQDPGGGVPGVGWALGGITAATRGYTNADTHPPNSHPAHAPSPKVTKRTPPTTTTSSSTPKPPPATRPSVSRKLFLSNLDLFPTPPPPRPPPRARLSRSQHSTSATTSPGPVVPVVTGIWSAPATRAASVARSHSTDSPPPVKHLKLPSARRKKGKTPATKAAPRGTGGSVESAATPTKFGKGHKKVSRSGKSSTAEKTAIIPAAQEPTAILPAAQEPTAIIPAAQEPTASTSPAAQEATASTCPAAQEATASTCPAAQEATASTSPAGPERTAGTSPAGPARNASTSPAPLGQKGPPAPAPLGQTGPPAPARWARQDRQQLSHCKGHRRHKHR
ncbi:hypothetical protein NDU88_006228 [Pleurodeles waltl]|uniref:Uncharacterized protein n=1 Tax=Pleurodeles waltl TaxID=8319 RepID=A0AAV7X0K3_PLEWA|nr:hypothetical protein NDU88_006228 [Pleurodeles waltl]